MIFFLIQTEQYYIALEWIFIQCRETWSLAADIRVHDALEPCVHTHEQTHVRTSAEAERNDDNMQIILYVCGASVDFRTTL